MYDMELEFALKRGIRSVNLLVVLLLVVMKWFQVRCLVIFMGIN